MTECADVPDDRLELERDARAAFWWSKRRHTIRHRCPFCRHRHALRRCQWLTQFVGRREATPQ